jgi:ATP-dependent Clp protease protease subunit
MNATLDDSVFERLLRERIVVLGQEIDDPLANRIIAQLLLLAAEDPSADITLYINSPSGSVSSGMAIFDTMNAIEPDVATVATGPAASMGQFLLAAGAPPASGPRCRTPRC